MKVKQKYTEKAISKIELFDADMGCTYLKDALEHIIHLGRKSKKKTRVFIITDEFSKKEVDIVEKVIFLLESSMQIYLSDFKLTIQKTPQNFY